MKVFGHGRRQWRKASLQGVGWATAVGARRDNQDRCSSGPGWAVLCDGIGGQPGGAVAAQAAVEAAADELGRRPLPTSTEEASDALAHAAQQAHAAVQRAKAAEPRLARMGTTLTAAVAAGPGAWVVGSLGDSPAWVVSKTSTRQVTQEHTVVGELQRLGLLAADEVDGHPGHHVLSRWVGMDGSAPLALETIVAQDGDRLVLASDGLIQGVATTRLHEIMAPWAGLPLRRQAQLLVKAALAGGATDNVTVAVLIPVLGAGAQPQDMENVAAPRPEDAS